MQKYRDTNEMELKIDIRTMIKDVLRYSWLIVIMAISFSLIAYMIIDSSYKPKYTSSTTFIVTGKGLNNSIYDNLLTAQDMTNRFKNIIDSNILKEKIAEAEDVLVLTDMLSASTTQIAATLLPRGKIEIVSGVNLAMLIYAIRERNFYDVTDLAEKAKQAALEDIVNVRKRMNEE